MRLPSHRREPGDQVEPDPATEPPLDREQLEALRTGFAPPQWLRDIGLTSWFLLGFFGLLAGLTWLLGATYTIVGPVVAASIVAMVASPIVATLQRHRVPRAAGAAIVLLAILALGIVVLVVVLAGITSQQDGIATYAKEAADKVESWLESVGVDHSGASSAESDVTKSVPAIISTLTKGIVEGIAGVASLAFALSFTLLSLFFLLKDGPSMRRWIDRHLGVPQPVAHVITTRVIGSMRGYFRGVTIVAAFNGVVVALGALALGVPLAGTIGVVSFVTAYIPYIGAFVAGAFAVILALGAKGTSTALIMLVIVLLANGLLQNILQPFAMGSALNLHPLAVLVLTIGAGCIFGMLGLVLAAPLTSAVVHVTRDLSRARARAPTAEQSEATTAAERADARDAAAPA
jgi:predicted PurR-regulated permease PerM